MLSLLHWCYTHSDSTNHIFGGADTHWVCLNFFSLSDTNTDHDTNQLHLQYTVERPFGQFHMNLFCSVSCPFVQSNTYLYFIYQILLVKTNHLGFTWHGINSNKSTKNSQKKPLFKHFKQYLWSTTLRNGLYCSLSSCLRQTITKETYVSEGLQMALSGKVYSNGFSDQWLKRWHENCSSTCYNVWTIWWSR